MGSKGAREGGRERERETETPIDAYLSAPGSVEFHGLKAGSDMLREWVHLCAARGRFDDYCVRPPSR